MARSGRSEGVYGLRYLTVVAVATIAVASLALAFRDRGAALGAAVLGLYALHLVSVRVVLRSQRRNRDALFAQLELLHQLVEDAAAPLAAPGPATIGRSIPEVPSRADVPRGQANPPGQAVPPVDAPSTDAPPADAPAADAPRRSGPRSPPGRIAASGNGFLPVRGDEPERTAGRIPVGTRTGVLPPGDAEPGEIPIPRHFALGTVALIRQLLTPAEVARVLMEQRSQPDRRFATLAVEMGLLSDSQREELLLAQQEGLFTEQEMRDARERLREFRESTARAMSDLE